MQWLLLTIAAMALPAVLIWWKHWSFGRDFDAEVWQDQVAIHEGARQGMAARLIADGTLIGKTRAEVVEILGEPPWRLPFIDPFELCCWHRMKYGVSKESSQASVSSLEEWLPTVFSATVSRSCVRLYCTVSKPPLFG